ncbi:hypothetical protein B296_00013150, partial [Ensete ventricosum]
MIGFNYDKTITWYSLDLFKRRIGFGKVVVNLGRPCEARSMHFVDTTENQKFQLTYTLTKWVSPWVLASHPITRQVAETPNKAQDAIFYSYTKYINGFAADLEEEEAMEMSSAWPESESFKDEGMGPIPPKWKGICQNDTDKGVRCNRSDHYVIIIDLTADADALRRKLIGLRYFNKGYGSAVGAVGLAAETPRDTDGHGTH